MIAKSIEILVKPELLKKLIEKLKCDEFPRLLLHVQPDEILQDYTFGTVSITLFQ
jgi:hypothetical protein